MTKVTRVRVLILKKVSKKYYLTLKQCQKHDLDEDESVIRYLMKAYQSGAQIPPIILNHDFTILDGSHRMGAMAELKYKEIEAFVLIP